MGQVGDSREHRRRAALFRNEQQGRGMVRLGIQRLIGSMGLAWADTNGLSGESDVLGRGHWNLESEGRAQTRELQRTDSRSEQRWLRGP